MIETIFSISDDVRYVAIYRDGKLDMQSKAGTVDASSSESDKYEELIANPVMLKTASQRGNIDCGGLDFLLIKYGNFYQCVLPASWGHVSVCVEDNGDPITITNKVKTLLAEEVG